MCPDRVVTGIQPDCRDRPGRARLREQAIQDLDGKVTQAKLGVDESQTLQIVGATLRVFLGWKELQSQRALCDGSMLVFADKTRA